MTNTAETEYAELPTETEAYERCEHAWDTHDDDPAFGQGCVRCGIPRAAYDKLSTLLAENAELRERNDLLRKDTDDFQIVNIRLREALEPFAEIVVDSDDSDSDGAPDGRAVDGYWAAEQIRFGHLRRARAALG